METENLEQLRELRTQEKALKAKIEATEILAIIEAQGMTDGGKFTYKGHEFGRNIVLRTTPPNPTPNSSTAPILR